VLGQMPNSSVGWWNSVVFDGGKAGNKVRSIDNFREETNTRSVAASLFKDGTNSTLQWANVRGHNEHRKYSTGTYLAGKERTST
jgi:hypothetical protein